MGSHYDESDFVDADYQASLKTSPTSPRQSADAAAGQSSGRPPSREEIESRVSETQAKLADLKRAQEELERERAALEDSRRRRLEFQNGRTEMLDHLGRGVSLLEQAEFAARRDAEQMAKSLADLRENLARLEPLREEQWSEQTWNSELTRALAAIEHARMEWNSARLKWPLLDGTSADAAAKKRSGAGLDWAEDVSFKKLCRVGLALNWPVALVTLIGLLAIIVMLARR